VVALESCQQQIARKSARAYEGPHQNVAIENDSHGIRV
jgi:hypothetical protein